MTKPLPKGSRAPFQNSTVIGDNNTLMKEEPIRYSYVYTHRHDINNDEEWLCLQIGSTGLTEVKPR